MPVQPTTLAPRSHAIKRARRDRSRTRIDVPGTIAINEIQIKYALRPFGVRAVKGRDGKAAQAWSGLGRPAGGESWRGPCVGRVRRLGRRSGRGCWKT